MSTLCLTHTSQQLAGTCTVTGSKSETNRLLILQALFSELELQNLSNSDDTQAMIRGLSSLEETINIGHAGTTMRFLTSYLATTPRGGGACRAEPAARRPPTAGREGRHWGQRRGRRRPRGTR